MNLFVVALGLAFADPAGAAFETLPFSTEVADTLRVGDESNGDAKDCLQGLCWEPGKFKIECSRANGAVDVWLKYASPLPSGVAQNDVVVIEGSLAKDKAGQPRRARAVVVVHESGSGMTVGKLIASGFRDRGVHAFMVQLPFYGQRRGAHGRPKGTQVAGVMRQAIADVRRARDAVAALPWVDAEHIAVQGTSLGGFVVSNVGALDQGFDSVFILLAGGDLFGMMQTGQREVAQLRRELREAGIEGEALKNLLQVVEPNRTAHRLRPDHTWLYSALLDQVVPIENGNVLAKKAKLAPPHHIKLLADHYTGIVYLPLVLDHMQRQVLK